MAASAQKQVIERDIRITIIGSKYGVFCIIYPYSENLIR